MEFKTNIYLGNKLIKCFYLSMRQDETIRKYLFRVNEVLILSGLNENIKVVWPKGQRITETWYELHGNYGCGWECLCSEKTLREARQRRKEYRENEGGAYRIVTKRYRVN